MEYNSEEELFDSLKGALKVKLRIANQKYDNITMTDIWNYLKLNKWRYDKDLTISEMANDIIDADINKINKYIIEKAKEM